jgi:hypothetical protein
MAADRAGLLKEPTEASIASDSLAAELEAFRDKALRLLRVRITKKEWARDIHGNAPFSRQIVATAALKEALKSISSKSVAVEFWDVALDSLSEFHGLTEINLEQLTKLFFAWLDSAIAGQWEVGDTDCSIPVTYRRKNLLPEKFKEVTAGIPAASLKDQAELREQLATMPWAPVSDDNPHGRPVYLCIYDAFAVNSIRFVNSILAPEGSNWRLGGAFHAGVEINGMEWSYGYSDPGETGVAWNIPRNHHQHRFRQAILIGYTQLSQDLIMDVLTDLIEEFRGQDYRMFDKNCCHFADEFCKRLGVGDIPTWVHRLGHIASNAQGLIKGLTGCSCTNMELAAKRRQDDDNKAQWLYRL